MSRTEVATATAVWAHLALQLVAVEAGFLSAAVSNTMAGPAVSDGGMGCGKVKECDSLSDINKQQGAFISPIRTLRF